MRRAYAFIVSAALVCTGCHGSRDQLLANLQSIRPEERALAVRKLADQGNPDDLVLFTRAAKDTAALVRAEAAAALGRSQDTRVVDLLGELLGDPDEAVQAQAAAALAEIKNDKAKAYLTLQYARRGSTTRQAIVEALKAANVPGAMASVVAAESQSIWERNLKALTDGSLPERVAAAEELGKSGRVEAVNRLLPLIQDSHVILAAAAVRGLGYAGDPRAVEPIAGLLSENFPELREAATEALVRLRDPKALPRLKEIALEKSTASPLATAAIIALPESAESSKALCELALGAAPEEARTAARAMRSRGGCALEPILEKLSRRADQIDSLHALQGLGPTAVAATPKVVPVIGASDSEVRLEAIRAASELGDATAVEALRKVYDQEVKRISELRADWISSKLPADFASESSNPVDPKTLKHNELMRRVRESNRARLKEAGKEIFLREPVPAEVIDDLAEGELVPLASTLEALGRMKSEGALQLLEPWQNDPSPSIRAAASVGLTALGPEGIARAKASLLDASRDVQSAVALALAEQGNAGQAPIAEILPKLAADRLPFLSAIERAGPAPVMTEALITVLKEGGAEAILAAQLLGRLQAKEAVEPLMSHLEETTSVARRHAIVALGQIGDPRAAEIIARDLNHEISDVRAAAVEALDALNVNPRPSALDALKGDYYRRVRDAADAALAEGTGEPKSIEAKTPVE